MMSRTRATITLLAVVLLFWVLVKTPATRAAEASPLQAGDVATYQSILSRLRTGEPYHRIVGDELRRGHYATREVFNWRTPLLWSALARVPNVAGRGALIALGLLVLGATLAVTTRQPIWVALGDLMQAGTVVVALAPNAAVMGEVWCGTLLGLSVCMYARRRADLAVLAALLALFIRELAAPYCVACAIAAAMSRRWREVGAWLGGACLYAAYYGWHLVQVQGQRLPTDLAHESSWVEFGGLPALLAKAQWQAWLLVSPSWVTALALTLIGAGLVSARAPVHVRLTSAVYAGFFLVAGKVFDGYWGLAAWPVWALACGYGADLVHSAACAVVARPRPAGITSGLGGEITDRDDTGDP